MKKLNPFLPPILSLDLNVHYYPYVLEVKVPNACTYRFGFEILSTAEYYAQIFLHVKRLQVSILNVIENERTIYKLK